MSIFLRDILSKGRIWESVDQRVVEKQEKGEDALERLLARQEETAMLVRDLVQQVDFCPFFSTTERVFVFVCLQLNTGGGAASARKRTPEAENGVKMPI